MDTHWYLCISKISKHILAFPHRSPYRYPSGYPCISFQGIQQISSHFIRVYRKNYPFNISSYPGYPRTPSISYCIQVDLQIDIQIYIHMHIRAIAGCCFQAIFPLDICLDTLRSRAACFLTCPAPPAHAASPLRVQNTPLTRPYLQGPGSAGWPTQGSLSGGGPDKDVGQEVLHDSCLLSTPVGLWHHVAREWNCDCSSSEAADCAGPCARVQTRMAMQEPVWIPRPQIRWDIRWDIRLDIRGDIQKDIQKDIHMDMHMGSQAKSWDPRGISGCCKTSKMSAYVLWLSTYTSAIIMTCRWESNPCHQSYNLIFLSLNQQFWSTVYTNSMCYEPL